MKILILFFDSNHGFYQTVANQYAEVLTTMGHIAELCNVAHYQTVDQLEPVLHNIDADFGISLNLAGMNLLTTGEDSILTTLRYPFAYELFSAPYYYNHFFDTRINFNVIIYTHNSSDASYIETYFPDVPAVMTSASPDLGETYHLLSHGTKESILQEIHSLPDVFSHLCLKVLDRIPTGNYTTFSQLVLSELENLGIDNLSREEAIELITMCSLAQEYFKCDYAIPSHVVSIKEHLNQLIHNANLLH